MKCLGQYSVEFRVSGSENNDPDLLPLKHTFAEDVIIRSLGLQHNGAGSNGIIHISIDGHTIYADYGGLVVGGDAPLEAFCVRAGAQVRAGSYASGNVKISYDKLPAV